MSPLTEPTRLTLRKSWQPMDPDAAAYITAVEAADTAAGQSGGLEEKTKIAIDNFVLGCKADGIWSAIKASCILAGARTLNGALVPLVGTAPSKFGTEGGWNYNRKTGLQGNGTDNYLNSNRSNSADPQNSFHMSTWASAIATSGYYIASNVINGGSSFILNDSPNTRERWGSRSYAADQLTSNTHNITGFKGSTRSNGSTFSVRTGGATVTPTGGSLTSIAAESALIYVFARNGISNTPGAFLSNTGRISFYSIGESLDLALLDTRVSALITAIGAAIP